MGACSPRRSLPTRLSARSSLIALVVLALSAAPASAGTYDVLSGSAAPSSVNNAWISSNTRRSHLVTRTALPARTSPPSNYPNVSYLDGIYAADYLRDDSGGPTTNVPEGSEAFWRLAAPEATTITGLTYRRYLGKQDDDDWIPFLRDGSGAIVAGETCTIGFAPAYRCQVGDAADSSSAERTIGGLSTARLEVGVRCPSNGTVICLNGGSLHKAWAAIYRSRVTINDPTSPTVSGESGELAGRGPQSGTRSISFDAVDNTGLKELRLYVDGAQATSSSRSCDYTRPRPCGDVSDASLSIDTASYSDGAHTLQVAAVDAGGNETRGTARTVVFSNPRPVPAPSSDGGGGGDGDSNDGGSSSGGSSESSSAPAPAVTSSPAPTLLAANLRLARPRVRAGRLTLTGTVAPQASGSVVLTCSARVGGRSRRIRGRGAIAGGRFAGRAPLRGLRGARRCSLTVSYAGNGLVAGQTLRRTVRVR
jgi:hypothetical protein